MPQQLLLKLLVFLPNDDRQNRSKNFFDVKSLFRRSLDQRHFHLQRLAVILATLQNLARSKFP